MVLKAVAAVVLVLVLAVVVRFALLSSGSPQPDNVGDPQRLAACPASPNCVNSQATDDKHAIEPLTATDVEAAMRRLETLVAELPRTRVVATAPGYLHAESRSRLFRFVDDLELLADPDKGVIHVRSASRVGFSDMRVNRKRVEELRRRFAG